MVAGSTASAGGTAANLDRIEQGRQSTYRYVGRLPTDPIMSPKDPPTSRIELLQGTLDFIILQALRWGPCHGYGIVQLIRSQSRNVLQVETGSLYPALQRLTRQGAIAAEWRVSANGRRVRTYRLTTKGRARLTAERTRWEQLSEAMAAMMVPPATEET